MTNIGQGGDNRFSGLNNWSIISVLKLEWIYGFPFWLKTPILSSRTEHRVSSFGYTINLVKNCSVLISAVYKAEGPQQGRSGQNITFGASQWASGRRWPPVFARQPQPPSQSRACSLVLISRSRLWLYNVHHIYICLLSLRVVAYVFTWYDILFCFMSWSGPLRRIIVNMITFWCRNMRYMYATMLHFFYLIKHRPEHE